MFYEVHFQNAHILWRVIRSSNLQEIFDHIQKANAQYIYISTFDSYTKNLLSMRCFKPSELPNLDTWSQLFV
jgi:hypothetical protein